MTHHESKDSNQKHEDRIGPIGILLENISHRTNCAQFSTYETIFMHNYGSEAIFSEPLSMLNVDSELHTYRAASYATDEVWLPRSRLVLKQRHPYQQLHLFVMGKSKI